MIENDLNKGIAELNKNVETLNRRLGGSWTHLWRGILSGFGYVFGALIAVLIIGWILNIVGIIPAFRSQIDSLKNSLQQAQIQSRAALPNK
jgi:hypothetical protein